MRSQGACTARAIPVDEPKAPGIRGIKHSLAAVLRVLRQSYN